MPAFCARIVVPTEKIIQACCPISSVVEPLVTIVNSVFQIPVVHGPEGEVAIHAMCLILFASVLESASEIVQTAMLGIVQKVFSEKASAIARMRQKCVRNASEMRQKCVKMGLVLM